MDGKTSKENLGIVVQYKVKIRASIAGIGGKFGGGGEIVAELPFTLTHSKPAETPERKVGEEYERLFNREDNYRNGRLSTSRRKQMARIRWTST